MLLGSSLKRGPEVGKDQVPRDRGWRGLAALRPVCHPGKEAPFSVISKQGVLATTGPSSTSGASAFLRTKNEAPHGPPTCCTPSSTTHRAQGSWEEEAKQSPACPLDLPRSPPATGARPSPRGWWLSACNAETGVAVRSGSRETFLKAPSTEASGRHTEGWGEG